ncbi:C4-type zinc ribbon domain-containing protein [Sinomonas sp. ASV322]|uniref:zinc ribbon domain-containing protein n=1 Tax=Sinomonas sp. ASV322 TaxID=3041920 RepID=UPI0027DB673B|nr:C4-type zinc ribbon domain-containing protein [Sinomonas sp. ASV322]MDQ4502296.1 C4-type zinc ribbon domain-containing protein [Sinomonas sp. ASV322]
MPKAPAAEQLKLLDLQALDAKLRSLDVRRKALEEDPRLSSASDALTATSRSARDADLAVDEAQAALVKAEDSVAQVAARIERDEARLYAGGLSKDLQALQQDIAALSSRRSDLEDAELEILERLDGLRAEQSTAAAALAEAQTASAGLRSELDAKLAEIAEERVHVARDRADCAARIEDTLVEVYEKTLAKRGVGAARLFHGTSEGSGMALSPGDLATIRSAAADDIVFCPDSGCILVRSPEWS